MTRLEFIEGSSSKFWETEVKGKSLVTRFGRIGGEARMTEKRFASPQLAQAELAKLVAQKEKKGYLHSTRAKPAHGTAPAVSPRLSTPAAPLKHAWSGPLVKPKGDERRVDRRPLVTGDVVISRADESDHHELVCADRLTGKPRWVLAPEDVASTNFGLFAPMSGVMVAHGELLLVPTKYSVVAVNLSSGKVKWRVEERVDLSEPSAIVVHDGSAWRTLGTKLTEIPLGKPKLESHFTVPSSSRFFGGLHADEETLVVMANKRFLGVSWKNPKKASWNRSSAELAFPGVGFTTDLVILPLCFAPHGFHSGVCAVDREKGKERWCVGLTRIEDQEKRWGITELAVVNGTVLVKDWGGHLLRLDAQSGATLWEAKPSTRPSGRRGPHGRFAVGEGTVYSVQVDGSKTLLVALDLSTGKELYRLPTPKNDTFSTASRPIFHEGWLYVQGRAALHAFGAAR